MNLANRASPSPRRIEKIEFKDVSFSYVQSHPVLDSVSIALPMKEICHVTGPTGHGQATVLKLMSFIAEPTAGQILINNDIASEMSFDEFLPWRLEIGYTFENGGLLTNRTLEENMMLPQLYHNLSDADDVRAAIHTVAKRFKFSNLLDRRPALVSGGLRKLVTILRPVLMRPSVLILDDPFSGLDPDTAKELEKLIFEIREKSTIETMYFTSRDETWPERLGARQLWVEGGKIEFNTERRSA